MKFLYSKEKKVLHRTEPDLVPLTATAKLNLGTYQVYIGTNDQQKQKESKAAVTGFLCGREAASLQKATGTPKLIIAIQS